MKLACIFTWVLHELAWDMQYVRVLPTLHTPCHAYMDESDGLDICGEKESNTNCWSRNTDGIYHIYYYNNNTNQPEKKKRRTEKAMNERRPQSTLEIKNKNNISRKKRWTANENRAAAAAATKEKRKHFTKENCDGMLFEKTSKRDFRNVIAWKAASTQHIGKKNCCCCWCTSGKWHRVW